MFSRVLVAEANPEHQLAFRRFFDAQGFAVEYSTCGKDSIEMLKQAPFDLVLLALDIPCGGGPAVLSQIDELPIDTQPAVVLTGTCNQHSKIAGYLKKPFNESTLLGEICQAFVGSEPEAAYFHA